MLIEFFLAVGVIGLERWVTRPVVQRNRTRNGHFWQLLCLLLDGRIFNWFRQFAVARAYLEFVRRIRRWEPSKRRAVVEASS